MPIAEQYGITLFDVNVLNKEQTLLEKLTSLVRFSFDEDPRQSIASKIRHFYDLYYLMTDADCAAFVRSAQFKERFEAILQHDRKLFDTPLGWRNKHVYESPLVADFEKVWKQLRNVYRRELSALAYAPIPDEKQIKEQFSIIIECIQ